MLRVSLLLLLLVGIGVVALVLWQRGTDAASGDAGNYEVSYIAGSSDGAGRFMGGTEIRALVAHGGKLYAGNGYWEDEPGPEAMQSAQILVLDGPRGQWRVDHSFDERMPGGRWRDLAVSILDEATFTTDGSGKPLARPVKLLIASNWDLSGQVRVFTRDDATGAWAGTTFPDRPSGPGSVKPQIRSFASHRDRVTGVDQVFVGQRPDGIFSGTYDADEPSRIKWSPVPELDISKLSDASLPGNPERLRVSSFAECNDRLYAAIGQQVFERSDGPQPSWRLVYSNPSPGHSETGLRGLSAMQDPAGHGQVLIAAIEGSEGRIVRIDPRNGSDVTDLDLKAFLAEKWGMRVGYTIAAYNNVTKVEDEAGREVLLIGFEAFIPPHETVAKGHDVVDVGYGRLESGGWYVVRQPDGHYDLRRVYARPGQALVATRSIVRSPFPNDADALYLAGYDANKSPVHDTAWIVRTSVRTAIAPAP